MLKMFWVEIRNFIYFNGLDFSLNLNLFISSSFVKKGKEFRKKGNEKKLNKEILRTYIHKIFKLIHFFNKYFIRI